MQGIGLGISGLAALGGGEGIAALAPLLAISDRRFKHNIRQIGALRNGVPVFEFSYNGSEKRHVGFMADSVPVDAVYDFCGFKLVDYARVLEA